MSSSAATLLSYEQLIAVEPTLNKVACLRELKPDLPHNTLYHAGPPYSTTSSIPKPVVNSASAAATLEGWVTSDTAARKAVTEGEILLKPAQDIGLVTPLAFVAGPSTWCVEVIDSRDPTRRYLSPVNDGPPPFALRFGTGSSQGIDFVKQLNDSVAEEFDRYLKTGTRLLPLLADAISNGDDLHGHVAAFQSRLPEMFEMKDLSQEATQYLQNANQFVLNIVMASAALMLRGGSGISDSQMVTACGGNGVMLGYKLSGRGDEWLQQPAHQPVGQKFPRTEHDIALPAIGDSAVIDALGFGAANLRFCETLHDSLLGHVDADFFTEKSHQAYIGPHPGIPLADLHVGLDLERPRTCLGIMLGMVDAAGKSGLIGRGVAPWDA